MAFQFQCPHDHLLEGDESQAGQAIHCPVCGVLFLIPDPAEPPEPVIATGPQPAATAAKPAEPELLHIPCPNGHELEVPPEMLETEVLCPQCNAQFFLRARDSIEHRRRREEQERLRDEKLNRFWLRFSIGVAVAAGLLILTLLIMSTMRG
jgi:DNA-directed RNA polymerase subunit RPC12/RpoP